MATMTRAEIEAYLGAPHIAQLVTVRPDGRPHTAPVWFIWEGGHAKVMADANAVKVKNLRSNPKAALSIATGQRPYRYVVLEGEATVTERNLTRGIERLCVRYDGEERGKEFSKELLSEGRMVLIDIVVRRTVSWKEDD